jgi:hypothetical protein
VREIVQFSSLLPHGLSQLLLQLAEAFYRHRLAYVGVPLALRLRYADETVQPFCQTKHSLYASSGTANVLGLLWRRRRQERLRNSLYASARCGKEDDEVGHYTDRTTCEDTYSMDTLCI